jgi:heavy metal-binding protein
MRVFAIVLLPVLLLAQQAVAPSNPQKVNPAAYPISANAPDAAAAAQDDVEWVCPMDKDVREKAPGKCPRCGMTLVAGIPDEREYRVELTTKPRVLKPNEDIQLKFDVQDPDSNKTVQSFEIMHEKLYHLFLVSQDMQFFRHVHPEKQPDGTFLLDAKFPHPGLYRVLSDFYPTGGTPQLISRTVMVPGAGFKLTPAKLTADLEPKNTENLHVELTLDPPQPLAGFKTIMFFKLTPNEGIEQYIGAWAHVMVASSDLIDMIHTHPIYVTDPDEGAYKQIQINMIFPRTGMYRLWIQFQRHGVVNTAAFNIPVNELK